MEDIFQMFLTSTKDELKGASDKLKDITPSPMNTMLEKESKSTAVQKKMERSKKITENVAPTTPGISSHIIMTYILVLCIKCIFHVHVMYIYHRYAILYN